MHIAPVSWRCLSLRITFPSPLAQELSEAPASAKQHWANARRSTLHQFCDLVVAITFHISEPKQFAFARFQFQQKLLQVALQSEIAIRVRGLRLFSQWNKRVLRRAKMIPQKIRCHAEEIVLT